MSELALELKGITRTFHQGGRELSVLRDAEMALKRGEIVALVVRQERANRPCCTLRACSNGQMPVKS
jgi:predicted ABC-type transport system involved in lysophospholipase L1 biosynthesis ATPase subunit